MSRPRGGPTPLPAIPVRARAMLNATWLFVQPGERYLLEAAGTWGDFGIRAGADGFATDEAPRVARRVLRAAEGRRRMAEERWLSLCACVGRGGTPFHVGAALDWMVPADARGELLVWANDVPGFYWNNHGRLLLTITPLDG